LLVDQDLLSVTFILTAERSRLRILILQAAMLAVSATTHIYVFDCQSLTEDYMWPNVQTAQLLGLRSK